jgi:tRNA(Ser,Leu) C12 N-acetylase TAN1
MAITFPARTTNLFQALDLVFFGALKKLKASATGEFDDDSVRAQVSKLIQAYEQTATSSTIRGSFRRAELEHDTTRRSFRLEVAEETLRENPGFQEIWGATYLLRL